MKSHIRAHFQKGFTLIELLVVIGILAILVVGLMVAINPQDKLRQANDTKVLNDIGSIGKAIEAYAAANGGFYPSQLSQLVPGELRAVPTAPTGYAAYQIVAAPAGCTAGVSCTSVYVYGQLMSNRYTAATPATPRALFSSVSGKTCTVAATATTCP